MPMRHSLNLNVHLSVLLLLGTVITLAEWALFFARDLPR